MLSQHAGRCAAQVLTTGSWPTQSVAKCSMPRELERCCEDFRSFYLASHSGRKLSWQTTMGHAGAAQLILRNGLFLRNWMRWCCSCRLRKSGFLCWAVWRKGTNFGLLALR